MEARAFFISKSFPFRRRFAGGAIALNWRLASRCQYDPGSESEIADNWQARGTSSNSLQHSRACAHLSHKRTATQAATAFCLRAAGGKTRRGACKEVQAGSCSRLALQEPLLLIEFRCIDSGRGRLRKTTQMDFSPRNGLRARKPKKRSSPASWKHAAWELLSPDLRCFCQ